MMYFLINMIDYFNYNIFSFIRLNKSLTEVCQNELWRCEEVIIWLHLLEATYDLTDLKDNETLCVQFVGAGQDYKKIFVLRIYN